MFNAHILPQKVTNAVKFDKQLRMQPLADTQRFV